MRSAVKVMAAAAPAPQPPPPPLPQQELHAQLHRQRPSPPPGPSPPAAAAAAAAGGSSGGGGMCDEKTVEYLRDLIAEKHELEQVESGGSRKAIVTKLLEQGRTLNETGASVQDASGT